MKFKEAIEKIDGLRFVAAEMDIHSAVGRSLMLESDFLISPSLIERHLEETARTVAFISDSANEEKLGAIRRIVGETRDIRTSLVRLSQGESPDDVELFEIKGLAILTRSLDEIIEAS